MLDRPRSSGKLPQNKRVGQEESRRDNLACQLRGKLRVYGFSQGDPVICIIIHSINSQ